MAAQYQGEGGGEESGEEGTVAPSNGVGAAYFTPQGGADISQYRDNIGGNIGGGMSAIDQQSHSGVPGGGGPGGPGGPGAGNNSSQDKIQMGRDEYEEFQRLKEYMQQQAKLMEQQKLAQQGLQGNLYGDNNNITAGGPGGDNNHVSYLPPNHNIRIPRLVLTKEENTQYRAFVKYKQNIFKQIEKYKENNLIKYKDYGKIIDKIMDANQNMYSQEAELFEKLEKKCNDQWDMNNIDKGPEFDTIEAMKSKIKQFEYIDNYIKQSGNIIINYLQSVYNKLNKASTQIDKDCQILRKDGKLPSINELQNILTQNDDEKASNDNSNVQILRLEKELEAERAKNTILEAKLNKVGGKPAPEVDNNDIKLPDEIPFEPQQQSQRVSQRPSQPKRSSDLPPEEPNPEIQLPDEDPFPRGADVKENDEDNNNNNQRGGQKLLRNKDEPAPPNGVERIVQWNIKPSINENRGILPMLGFKSNNNVPVLVCKGSVLDFTGHAIVNATNESCVGVQGVDGAINKAGGESYATEILSMKVLSTVKIQNGNKMYKRRLYSGQAAIIKSGYETNDLKTEYVILTVGPRYNDSSKFTEADEQLYNAYKNCMIVASKNNISTIGFCLISAGLFRGRSKLSSVLKIGCEAIKNHLYNGCKGIYIIAFTDNELFQLMSVAKEVFGKPDIKFSKS